MFQDLIEKTICCDLLNASCKALFEVWPRGWPLTVTALFCCDIVLYDIQFPRGLCVVFISAFYVRWTRDVQIIFIYTNFNRKAFENQISCAQRIHNSETMPFSCIWYWVQEYYLVLLATDWCFLSWINVAWSVKLVIII